LPAAPGEDEVRLRLAAGHGLYRASLFVVGLDAAGTAGPIDFPVMAEEDWTALVTAIGGSSPAGDGALVIYTHTRNLSGDLVPLAGVASTSPGGALVYYDNGAALEWDQDLEGTGTDGVILIAPVAPGAAVNVTLDDGTSIVLLGVPVEADTITFADVEF
jgi:hypothetical protein